MIGATISQPGHKILSVRIRSYQIILDFLKLASPCGDKRKYSKKFFVYAVDVRTAMSARYAEMAIKSCFSEADSQEFTDVTTRDINSTTVSQRLNDSSIQKTLEYLKNKVKLL